MKRRWGALISLTVLAAGALLFAACEPGYRGTFTAVPGAINYESLDGHVRVDGSSTVFPIGEAVAEEFSRLSRTRVNVGFSGTGGGIEKLCRKVIDLSNASRPIRDSELEACAKSGIDDIIEFQVATDALTVMVNPSNDFVDCLTIEQLHEIFRAGGARNWQDIDESWPDKRIVPYHPGTDSGTFDYFVEEVIEGVDEMAHHRGDGTASEDDNVLMQGVEGDANGVGYFGFAYFLEAADKLRPVAIDAGDGCVAPSFETALDGSYPLSRPLFIYTREEFLRERREVLGFVDFYLRNSPVLSEEVGYIPLTEDALAQQITKIEPFLTGGRRT